MLNFVFTFHQPVTMESGSSSGKLIEPKPLKEIITVLIACSPSVVARQRVARIHPWQQVTKPDLF